MVFEVGVLLIWLVFATADNIVGMDPAFEGATVELLARCDGNMHPAAFFDVGFDRVGNHVLLIVWSEIVFVDIFNDFLQKFLI